MGAPPNGIITKHVLPNTPSLRDLALAVPSIALVMAMNIPPIVTPAQYARQKFIASTPVPVKTSGRQRAGPRTLR
jgi:hypothetical protein